LNRAGGTGRNLRPVRSMCPERQQGLVALVGTARCAVPVAERSVRRRNEPPMTYVSPRAFRPPSRAGTAQRAVPTIGIHAKVQPKPI
jgi:hypothetical protein